MFEQVVIKSFVACIFSFFKQGLRLFGKLLYINYMGRFKFVSKKRLKKLFKRIVKLHLWLVIVGLSVFLAGLLCVITIWWWFSGRAWPGVSVTGKYVGNMSKQEIVKIFSEPIYAPHYLTLKNDGREWVLNLDELNWKIDAERTADMAVNLGKDWMKIGMIRRSLIEGVNLPLIYSIDDSLLANKLAGIASELYEPAVQPEVSILAGGLGVINGTVGQQVNVTELRKQIYYRLASRSSAPIFFEVEKNDLRLSDSESENLLQSGKVLLDKKLTFDLDDGEVLVWDGKVLIKLLGKGLISNSKIADQLRLEGKLLNVESQNAVFVFDDDQHKVKKFRHEVVGREIDVGKMVNLIHQAVNSLTEEATNEASLKMQFRRLYPAIKTADINNLGIEEVLGRGVSIYKGSISGRKFNVALGAKRINGTLVKPGGVFSFNKSVGEVSSATGYKKSYVIRSGETILDDGGGMCQVSTTMFRAALNAGLPILERHPHSYRVYYYEQDAKPGLDATVFAPSVDLKFINNTSGYILVQTTVDDSIPKLTIDIYGKNDGRTVEMSDIRVWDVTAPPEDLYVDDSSLPIGVVKQLEHKAWGAKSAFDWKVVRGGEVLSEKTFYSSYRPWQAVYLRGTKGG